MRWSQIDNPEWIILNEKIPNITFVNEITPNDIIPIEIILNEIIANEIIANEINPNEIIPNEIIPNEIIPNEIIPNEISYKKTEVASNKLSLVLKIQILKHSNITTI